MPAITVLLLQALVPMLGMFFLPSHEEEGVVRSMISMAVCALWVMLTLAAALFLSSRRLLKGANYASDGQGLLCIWGTLHISRCALL